jgi:hypothetical protein
VTTLRLFRQNETRQYPGVLDRVRDGLRARIIGGSIREDLSSVSSRLFMGFNTIHGSCLSG